MDATNLRDPIDKSDLAALVFFVLLLQDENGAELRDFEQQLDHFPKGPVQPELKPLQDFVKRLLVPENLAKIRPQAEGARMAVGVFIDALKAEKLWGDCRTLVLDQIKNIARFA